MSTRYTQAQFARLPKWAQREIDWLNKDVLVLETRLKAGPEDSRVFADVYSDAKRPLGNTQIQFVWPKHEGSALDRTVTAYIDKQTDRLRLTSEDSILVCPSATNSVHIIPATWDQVRDLTRSEGEGRGDKG